MIVARIVSGVKDHFIRRSPEWFMTYMLMQFGLSLLFFGSVFSTSISFGTMAMVADEHIWGWGCCIVAGARLAALFANGTFRKFKRASPIVRSLSAGLSGFVWFAIAIGMVSAGRPGSGTYFGLLVADIYLASWVVAGDAAAAERAHRNATTKHRAK